MDQIGDNNDDRNRLDEIALKEAIIGLDDREKNILRLRFAVKHRLRSLRKWHQSGTGVKARKRRTGKN